MPLKKLTKWPPFLAGLARAYNALIDDKVSHGDISGANGIKVVDAGPGGNILIDGKEILSQITGANGPLRDYVEKEITLCIEGEPVTGKILFKPDTPA